jgi:hypothetical protein
MMRGYTRVDTADWIGYIKAERVVKLERLQEIGYLPVFHLDRSLFF